MTKSKAEAYARKIVAELLGDSKGEHVVALQQVRDIFKWDGWIGRCTNEATLISEIATILRMSL